MHQQARPGITDLTGIVINPANRPVDGCVEIGQIAHKDLRALAAGLQRDALEVGLTGIDHQLLADGGRAGKADLGHVLMQG